MHHSNNIILWTTFKKCSQLSMPRVSNHCIVLQQVSTRQTRPSVIIILAELIFGVHTILYKYSQWICECLLTLTFCSTVNCTLLEVFFSEFCGDDNITLDTDPVAVVKSTSSVWTYVNTPDDNITLFYKLCRFIPSWNMVWGWTELINCTHNGTELDVEVEWNNAGVTNLSVFVFTANKYDRKHLLGCAKTGVTVAGKTTIHMYCGIHACMSGGNILRPMAYTMYFCCTPKWATVVICSLPKVLLLVVHECKM